MTAPEPSPHRDDAGTPSPRRALDLIHQNELRSARRQAIVAVFGTLLIAGVWIWSDAELGPTVFFFVGLALLWCGSEVWAWWRLRRRGPGDPATALAQRAAQQAALARHQAILAERPERLTWVLVGCIGVVTLGQYFTSLSSSVERAGLVKPLVREGEWWRLLTATYLHGGVLHFWFNFGSLRAFGPLVEAYAPRTRLPLVWLASTLTGSLASLVLMPDTTSVGASGGILGLLGYLWVMARRRPHELPPWLGSGLTATFAINAVLGIFGYAFIDNAAHAGGAAAGALIGLATIPRATGVTVPAEGAPAGTEPPHRDMAHHLLDTLGAIAMVVVVLGAFYTATRLGA